MQLMRSLVAYARIMDLHSINIIISASNAQMLLLYRNAYSVQVLPFIIKPVKNALLLQLRLSVICALSFTLTQLQILVNLVVSHQLSQVVSLVAIFGHLHINIASKRANAPFPTAKPVPVLHFARNVQLVTLPFPTAAKNLNAKSKTAIFVMVHPHVSSVMTVIKSTAVKLTALSNPAT